MGDTPAIVISRRGVRWLVVVLLLVAIVLAGIIAVRQGLIRLPAALGGGIAAQIDHGAYQAVFLAGGQVYFGKIQDATDDYITLTDVFYLSAGSDQQASQLIKRGNELHGPAEPMIIPMRSVVFIENLRANSDIVTAIGKFHAGQLPVATPPAITGAPTTAPTATPSRSPSPSR